MNTQKTKSRPGRVLPATLLICLTALTVACQSAAHPSGTPSQTAVQPAVEQTRPTEASENPPPPTKQSEGLPSELLPDKPALRTIDHQQATLTGLSQADIERAKDKLRIGYGHTSHGSQLSSGLEALDAFMGNSGLYAIGMETVNALQLDDYCMEGDAGYYPDWVNNTRDYLGPPDAYGRGSRQPAVNVILWAWCGQLSWYSPDEVQAHYLKPMSALEDEYPGVVFVYMTGHADASGLEGVLHQNNQQIRRYCETNHKWLYDFYDIESYDPDGNYYGDRYVDDACNYLDGGTLRNWAQDWQAAHPGEWYDCEAAHSEPLNANLKAFAAWQLFAAIANTLP